MYIKKRREKRNKWEKKTSWQSMLQVAASCWELLRVANCNSAAGMGALNGKSWNEEKMKKRKERKKNNWKLNLVCCPPFQRFYLWHTSELLRMEWSGNSNRSTKQVESVDATSTNRTMKLAVPQIALIFINSTEMLNGWRKWKTIN